AEELLRWLAEAKTRASMTPALAFTAEGTAASVSAPVQSQLKPIKVIPKGLRSFAAEDADFFLGLLPGPTSRDGLPESIRFWKCRLEERDPDKTFAVGILFGPSGCGKSSLVNAGLLPRLSDDVLVAYIEATPEDTEARIIRSLHRLCPNLDSR